MVAAAIRTVLRYPVGSVAGFRGEFATEYDTVTGYLYTCGAFYVLFSEKGMVNMERLDGLAVPAKKRRTVYGGK